MIAILIRNEGEDWEPEEMGSLRNVKRNAEDERMGCRKLVLFTFRMIVTVVLSFIILTTVSYL